MKKLLNPEGRIAKDTEVLPKLKLVILIIFLEFLKGKI